MGEDASADALAAERELSAHHDALREVVLELVRAEALARAQAGAEGGETDERPAPSGDGPLLLLVVPEALGALVRSWGGVSESPRLLTERLRVEDVVVTLAVGGGEPDLLELFGTHVRCGVRVLPVGMSCEAAETYSRLRDDGTDAALAEQLARALAG